MRGSTCAALAPAQDAHAATAQHSHIARWRVRARASRRKARGSARSTRLAVSRRARPLALAATVLHARPARGAAVPRRGGAARGARALRGIAAERAAAARLRMCDACVAARALAAASGHLAHRAHGSAQRPRRKRTRAQAGGAVQRAQRRRRTQPHRQRAQARGGGARGRREQRAHERAGSALHALPKEQRRDARCAAAVPIGLCRSQEMSIFSPSASRARYQRILSGMHTLVVAPAWRPAAGVRTRRQARAARRTCGLRFGFARRGVC
jgi:hypothetical protein